MERLIKSTKRCSIYLVTDQDGDKRIKRVLNSGDADVYRILRDNPHKFMPKIFSVSEEESRITVIEEFVEGEIVSESCFSEKQMLKAAKELCVILSHIHHLGVIHRDIKPSNILITPSGSICLIDFEAARKIKPQADSDTRYLGTAGFAPPEQYGFSQTDVRSDIYALGKTFECIFGSLAFEKKYRRIISKCTRLDPDERYPDADAVLKELNISRSAGAIAVSALGAVLILSLAVFVVYSDRKDEAVPTIAETAPSYSETVPVTASVSAQQLTEDTAEVPVTSVTTISETTSETTSAETMETSRITSEQTGDNAAGSAAATSEVTENTDPFAKYSGYYKSLDLNFAQRISEEEMAQPLLFKAADNIPMDYIIIDAESLRENKYVSMLCDYNGDGYDDLFQISAYNPEGQNEYFRSLCVSVVKIYNDYPDFHVISDNGYFRYLISTASMDQDTGMICDGSYAQISVLDVNGDGYRDIVLSIGSDGNMINTQVFYYNNIDLAYTSSAELNLYLFDRCQMTLKDYDQFTVPDGSVYSMTLEDTMEHFKKISLNVWDYEKYDDPLYQQFQSFASRY